MDAADDCYLSFVPVVKMRSPDAYEAVSTAAGGAAT
jgi:hypothetical protein